MSAAIINQAFRCAHIPAPLMDMLWDAGWRHFGETFFRYSESDDDNGGIQHITPLRLEVARFAPSKSQRRVLRKNEDLRTEFVPAALSDDVREMFQRHKMRFSGNVPEELDIFLSSEPATVPCECVQCRVWLGDTLIAASFLDIGQKATSAVYGVFDPAYSVRSLGIFTMLKEIEFTANTGRQFYYPGYATQEPSAYDYKKQFAALDFLDWQTGLWWPLVEN